MNRDQYANLLSWTMFSALNSAVIVAQNQQQRPLTPEEIENCQEAAAALVEGMKESYLVGVDARSAYDQQKNQQQKQSG